MNLTSSTRNAPDAIDDVSEPAARGVSTALWWLLFLLILKFSAPFIPLPNRATAFFANVFFIIAYVVGVVNFGAHSTRSIVKWPVLRVIGALVLALGVWFVLSFMASSVLGRAFQAANGKPSMLLEFAALSQRSFTDVSLLMAAILGGSLVARRVSSGSLLGPLCAILAMLDVWFVLFQGIAAQMIKDAPTYAAKVTAAAPSVGAAASRFHLAPVGIGAADYLFIGFFFAIMHRYAMNWRAATRWIVGLVALAILGVMFNFSALPGLPFIGLGAAIPNWKFFRYTHEEKWALIYAGGFLVILTLGIYFAQPYIIAQMQTVK